MPNFTFKKTATFGQQSSFGHSETSYPSKFSGGSHHGMPDLSDSESDIIGDRNANRNADRNPFRSNNDNNANRFGDGHDSNNRFGNKNNRFGDGHLSSPGNPGSSNPSSGPSPPPPTSTTNQFGTNQFGTNQFGNIIVTKKTNSKMNSFEYDSLDVARPNKGRSGGERLCIAFTFFMAPLILVIMIMSKTFSDDPASRYFGFFTSEVSSWLIPFSIAIYLACLSLFCFKERIRAKIKARAESAAMLKRLKKTGEMSATKIETLEKDLEAALSEGNNKDTQIKIKDAEEKMMKVMLDYNALSDMQEHRNLEFVEKEKLLQEQKEKIADLEARLSEAVKMMSEKSENSKDGHTKVLNPPLMDMNPIMDGKSTKYISDTSYKLKLLDKMMDVQSSASGSDNEDTTESLKARIKELETKLETKVAKIEELEFQNETLKEENLLLQEELALLQEEKETAVKEKVFLKEGDSESIEAIEDGGVDDFIKTTQKDLELDKTIKNLQKAQESIEEKDLTISTLEDTIMGLQESVENILKEKTSLKEDNQILRDDIIKLRKQNDEVSNSLIEHQKQREAEKETEKDYLFVQEQLQMEIAKRDEQIDGLESELALARSTSPEEEDIGNNGEISPAATSEKSSPTSRSMVKEEDKDRIESDLKLLLRRLQLEGESLRTPRIVGTLSYDEMYHESSSRGPESPEGPTVQKDPGGAPAVQEGAKRSGNISSARSQGTPKSIEEEVQNNAFQSSSSFKVLCRNKVKELFRENEIRKIQSRKGREEYDELRRKLKERFTRKLEKVSNLENKVINLERELNRELGKARGDLRGKPREQVPGAPDQSPPQTGPLLGILPSSASGDDHPTTSGDQHHYDDRPGEELSGDSRIRHLSSGGLLGDLPPPPLGAVADVNPNEVTLELSKDIDNDTSEINFSNLISPVPPHPLPSPIGLVLGTTTSELPIIQENPSNDPINNTAKTNVTNVTRLLRMEADLVTKDTQLREYEMEIASLTEILHQKQSSLLEAEKEFTTEIHSIITKTAESTQSILEQKLQLEKDNQNLEILKEGLQKEIDQTRAEVLLLERKVIESMTSFNLLDSKFKSVSENVVPEMSVFYPREMMAIKTKQRTEDSPENEPLLWYYYSNPNGSLPGNGSLSGPHTKTEMRNLLTNIISTGENTSTTVITGDTLVKCNACILWFPIKNVFRFLDDASYNCFLDDAKDLRAVHHVLHAIKPTLANGRDVNKDVELLSLLEGKIMEKVVEKEMVENVEKEMLKRKPAVSSMKSTSKETGESSEGDSFEESSLMEMENSFHVSDLSDSIAPLFDEATERLHALLEKSEPEQAWNKEKSEALVGLIETLQRKFGGEMNN